MFKLYINYELIISTDDPTEFYNTLVRYNLAELAFQDLMNQRTYNPTAGDNGYTMCTFTKDAEEYMAYAN